MNIPLLRDHIDKYKAKLKSDPKKYAKDLYERTERAAYYQSWTADRLSKMTEEDLYEDLTRLWAMRLWGYKKYVVDKVISDNSMSTIRKALAELVWGSKPIRNRWDDFRFLKGI